MSQIKVDTKIIAPSSINIRLINAETYEKSNIYRIFFEAFFGLFCAMIGVILSISKIDVIHIFCTIVFALTAITFLLLTIKTICSFKQDYNT